MTIPEAITIIKAYNKWRRANVDDFPMPDPKQLGLAIDLAIETLKQSKQSKKEIAALKSQVYNLNVRLSDIKDNSCKF